MLLRHSWRAPVKRERTPHVFLLLLVAGLTVAACKTSPQEPVSGGMDDAGKPIPLDAGADRAVPGNADGSTFISDSGMPVACGRPGAPCCPGNLCNGGGCCAGCMCVAPGAACGGLPGACTDGSCGACGGPGQPCCA